MARARKQLVRMWNLAADLPNLIVHIVEVELLLDSITSSNSSHTSGLCHPYHTRPSRTAVPCLKQELWHLEGGYSNLNEISEN